MNIARNNGDLILDPGTIPGTGIVFFYSNWSGSAVFLKHLIGILEEFPNIPLFVYDVDNEAFSKFNEIYHMPSHGFGETCWIYNGAIISKILNYKQEGENCIKYVKELEMLID